MAAAKLLDLARRYTADDLILDGARASVALPAGAVTAMELRRSMHEAPTITVRLLDEDYKLVRDPASPFGGRKRWGEIVAEIDGTRWMVRELDRTPTGFDITLYDEAVARLMLHRKRIKMSRGKVTRAEFVHRLCKAAGVRAVTPGGADVPQPIEDLTREDREQLASAERSRRLSRGPRFAEASRSGVAELRAAGLKVKGHKVNNSQIRNIARVLEAADAEGAKDKARKALVLACIVESLFKNDSSVDRVDHDSRGILQIRDKTQAGMRAQGKDVTNTDIASSVHAFLRWGFWGKGGAMEIARQNPGTTAGWVAQQTQGSAYPERYDEWSDEADAILSVWGGGDIGGVRTGTPDRAYVQRYEFRVEPDEDYWQAILRLADEVNWRAFAVNGRLWFAPESTLRRAAPVMVIRQGADIERAQGVDDIAWTWTFRRRLDSATVQAVMMPWAAPPGSVVRVVDEGPMMSGRWLVDEISRDLMDGAGRAEIQLAWPEAPGLEPASEVVTVSGEAPAGGGSSSGRSIDRVYAEAKRISRQGLPYAWGGGHPVVGKPSPSTRAGESQVGYDCSGYVAACLAAGDLGFKPGDRNAPDSGWMAESWGDPGEGKYLTLWANAQHVFLEFKIPGKKGRYADTSQAAGGGPGPRLRTGSRSTTGFVARHWPGT